MVNWKESQISKGLVTFGYKEEVKILQMPSTDSQIRYVRNLQIINNLIFIALFLFLTL